VEFTRFIFFFLVFFFSLPSSSSSAPPPFLPCRAVSWPERVLSPATILRNNRRARFSACEFLSDVSSSRDTGNANYGGERGYDHELSVSELFRKTLAVARRNYVSLLPVFAIAGIVNGLVFVLFQSPTSMPAVPSDVSGLTQTQLLSLLGEVARAIGFTWLNYFVSWLVLYFAVGVGIWRMSVASRRQSAGTEVDATSSPPSSSSSSFPSSSSSSYNPPKLNYVSLALTTLLSVLIVSLGLFLVVVGAIVAAIALYLSLAACVLEGKSAFSSLGRSRRLISGRWGKTFLLLAGTLIAVYVVALFVVTLIGLPMPSGAASNTVMLFVQNLLVGLLFPFVAASMFVLYSLASSVPSEGRPYAQPGKASSSSPASSSRGSPYDTMKPEPMGASYPSAPKSSPTMSNAAKGGVSIPPLPPPPPPPPPPYVAQSPSGDAFGSPSSSSPSPAAPDQSPLFCSSCGARLGQEEKFCHNCGSPV
jgi:hypothetical protein